ncbi:urease subunit gamma [Klebsiella pneumoniae]|uniref:urease subunit gamma n=1 Tax=Klebsiella pneumoniae TaxID=573 RepID=UPI002499F105|nr:urease subunit gamma [Klebsiella pneumoniae]MDI2723894.1 urease subunit gamma [Klebsiella pneumoniae]MDI2729819.1 urease subunit gamma [Klebsiella pneumoniae]
MQLTPREIEKLMVYTLADVALKRKNKGLKLNHPEAVAIITTTAMEGAREEKTLEVVMNEARTVLTKEDVMDGVADLIPHVQVEAIFTDGSRLVTVHDPIQ